MTTVEFASTIDNWSGHINLKGPPYETRRSRSLTIAAHKGSSFSCDFSNSGALASRIPLLNIVQQRALAGVDLNPPRRNKVAYSLSAQLARSVGRTSFLWRSGNVGQKWTPAVETACDSAGWSAGLNATVRRHCMGANERSTVVLPWRHTRPELPAAAASAAHWAQRRGREWILRTTGYRPNMVQH